MSIEALHEPSSTTSTATTRNNDSTAATAAATVSEPIFDDVQAELARLTTKRDELTQTLSTFSSVLVANQCDMRTPLIDRQGFPRADIDVAGVRTARNQIIRLRNDLELVQAQLQAVVLQGLPRKDEGVSSSTASKEANLETTTLPTGLTPFAKIDRIFPGGPADLAGIQREDLLLSIGHVNSANHDELRAVAAIVSSSQDLILDVRVQRQEHQLSLRLTPKTGWGGRGLLGCHIVPI